MIGLILASIDTTLRNAIHQRFIHGSIMPAKPLGDGTKINYRDLKDNINTPVQCTQQFGWLQVATQCYTSLHFLSVLHQSYLN